MLSFEGLYYAVGTIITSAVLGGLFSVVIVRGISNGIWFFTYRFVMWPMLVVYPFLLLFAATIPALMYRRIAKVKESIRFNCFPVMPMLCSMANSFFRVITLVRTELTGASRLYLPTEIYLPLCDQPHLVNFPFTVKAGTEVAMEEFLNSYIAIQIHKGVAVLVLIVVRKRGVVGGKVFL